MAVRLNGHIVKEHEMKVNSGSFVQTQLMSCSGYTAPIVNNKCLYPIEFLRYCIQYTEISQCKRGVNNSAADI